MYPGQLLDIRGLDNIPWWPLATGWWILGGLIILAVLGLVLVTRYLILYPPGSWRWEARRALVRLKRQQSQLTPKEQAARLSELLRRISIAQFGRPRIASLTGDEWLQCLQRLDTSGFSWPEHGRILLTLPYAPDSGKGDEDAIDDLIQAALLMIRHTGSGLLRRWRREDNRGV